MDKVCIDLPLKSEFVLIARLTSSGLAARLGIDIEKLEDIKVVISEVLNKCIQEKRALDTIHIEYIFTSKLFSVVFYYNEISQIMESHDEYSLGLSIIEALADRTMTYQSKDKLEVQFDI